jgi:GntR family transcriptional regulator of arabinose operon
MNKQMNTDIIKTLTPQRLRKEPIHRQIYQILREPIMSGVYVPGTKLPTEAELTKAYNVSRVTVRRALQDLAAEGLIEGRKSQGTFVRNGANIRAKHRFLLVHDNASPVNYPYLQLLLKGIQSEVQNLQFRLEMLATTNGLERADNPMISELIESGDFDGVISLTGYLTQEEIFRIEKNDIPIVFIGHEYEGLILGPKTTIIECDTKRAIRIIFDHFIETGHKNIGYIGKPFPVYLPNKKLIDQAFIEAGLKFHPNYYEPCDYGINPATEACSRLFKNYPELNAIKCNDDLQAIGVLQYFNSIGKKIPQEIAITGTGNFLEENSHFDITTVDYRLKEQGSIAVKCLEDLIAGKHVEKHIMLEPLLVRRKTA